MIFLSFFAFHPEGPKAATAFSRYGWSEEGFFRVSFWGCFCSTRSLIVSLFWTAFEIKKSSTMCPCSILRSYFFLFTVTRYGLHRAGIFFVSFQHGFVSVHFKELQMYLHSYQTCFFSLTGLNATSMSVRACAAAEFVGGHFRSVFTSEWRWGEPVPLSQEWSVSVTLSYYCQWCSPVGECHRECSVRIKIDSCCNLYFLSTQCCLSMYI